MGGGGEVGVGEYPQLQVSEAYFSITFVYWQQGKGTGISFSRDLTGPWETDQHISSDTANHVISLLDLKHVLKWEQPSWTVSFLFQCGGQISLNRGDDLELLWKMLASSCTPALIWASGSGPPSIAPVTIWVRSLTHGILSRSTFPSRAREKPSSLMLQIITC